MRVRSERKHREHMNQRRFHCQNDSCLVVIYALFSHCFVSSWGQRLCQIHVTSPHKIWLEWIVRILSKYVCVVESATLWKVYFLKNIFFLYLRERGHEWWGGAEGEGVADFPLAGSPTRGWSSIPGPRDHDLSGCLIHWAIQMSQEGVFFL